MDQSIPVEEPINTLILKLLSQPESEYQPPTPPFPLFDESLFHDVPFGKEMKEKNFILDKEAIFLNNGSFGATPRVVLETQPKWQRRMEKQLIHFMITELFPLQVYAIRELAKFIGANPQNVFLVSNATAGLNAVLRSLEFTKDDSIVFLNLGYNAINNTIKYISSRTGVQLNCVNVTTPIIIEKILQDLDKSLQPNTKLAVIDHITSSSGLLLPIKRIIDLCRNKGVPVAVDGAHAIGHVPLNIQELGADFYVANCHKWMYSCKGSAFLYINDQFKTKIHPTSISNFYGEGPNLEFMWVGTEDYSPKLSILTALEFYKRLGGERIREYCHTLAVRAGEMLVEKWNTRLVLSQTENSDYTQYLGNMVAVKLPVPYSFSNVDQMIGHSLWLHNVLWNRYKIEVPITIVNQELYVRISAQIYNEFDEYVKLASAIQEIYHLSDQ